MNSAGTDAQGRNEAKEQRLSLIRREAEEKGWVDGKGVRPGGSPMPIASPETGYYQQPMLKEPQWTPLIPLYFFVGGATGVLGVIGSLADVLAGERELAQKARWMALGGVTISAVLLITDLGRPSRFLYMLRVFKPQSTMSVGSWVLSGFGGSAGLSSLADLLRMFFGRSLFGRVLSFVGRTGSVLFGMPLHNYTGVLIGASVIPIWNNRIRQLPREFGMSGLSAGVGVLELAGHADNRALNALGLLSAGVESYEGIELHGENNRTLRPAKEGATGLLIMAAGVFSGPVPLALRVASMFVKDGRKLRRYAALSSIAGSLLLRYGWVRAGTVSSRDWKIPMDIPDLAVNS